MMSVWVYCRPEDRERRDSLLSPRTRAGKLGVLLSGSPVGVISPRARDRPLLDRDLLLLDASGSSRARDTLLLDRDLPLLDASGPSLARDWLLLDLDLPLWDRYLSGLVSCLLLLADLAPNLPLLGGLASCLPLLANLALYWPGRPPSLPLLAERSPSPVPPLSGRPCLRGSVHVPPAVKLLSSRRRPSWPR